MIQAPPPESIMRMGKWAVLALIAYALWHTSFGNAPSTSSPAEKYAGKHREKNCTENAGNGGNFPRSFSALVIPLMPNYVPTVHSEDRKTGTGETAICGQHARVQFGYATQKGVVILDHKESNGGVDIVIGGGTVLHGMELGLLGMKPGGERIMTFPDKLGFGARQDIHALFGNTQFKPVPNLETENIVARVSLMSLTPPTPVSTMPVRILSSQFGKGLPVQCGDTVRVKITLWKLDGTRLFSTEGSAPVIFTPGRSQVPYSIEQSILGMTPGSQRTLLLPPAYSKPLVPSANAPLLSLPTSEMVLADITLLPAEEPMPSQPATAPLPKK